MHSSYDNSVILVDKPTGITSSALLNRIKKAAGVKKAGHSGTLDKAASGLLVVCTGRLTRLCSWFIDDSKEYTAGVQLGITTDTCDAEGEVLEKKDFSGITASDIIDAVKGFEGDQLQIPPGYSALKIGGRRASDILRAGGTVDLKARSIRIDSIQVSNIDILKGTFDIRVACTKGTYIRALARDIGEGLNTGAHISSLRRLRSGSFSVDNGASLEEIASGVGGQQPLPGIVLKPAEYLTAFTKIVVNASARERVRNGAYFTREEVLFTHEPGVNYCTIIDENENLIAIAAVDMENWQISYKSVFI